MWIETLESRRLMSVTLLPDAPARPLENTAVRAALHAKKLPDRLSRNIIGSYNGFYALGKVSFAGSETMTIDSQTSTKFTGTLSFDDGAAAPFTATLYPRAQYAALGYGYLFIAHFKSGFIKKKGWTTLIVLRGEFQLGANGFIVQMNGRFNGKPVPKPHGELNLTPDDPSTFLR
jgi:hypothetical protein